MGPGPGAAAPEALGGAGREGPAPLFDAVLHPHRSLGPVGFLVLMGFVSAVSFTAGMAFLLAGAWPVFGFFGLDVLLVYIAFRVNYRSGRLYETLRLTERELTVRRVLPSGKVRSWHFQPHWLRVETLDSGGHHSQLRLASHGRSLVIGAFLTPEERVDLAQALNDALALGRAPARP